MQARTLFIDIETYSDVNLKDSGVDKYAESDAFEILLLGYAFNDTPVEVVDMTVNEIPWDVYYAFFDGETKIVAHNARFERTCLTYYFRRTGDLQPGEWLNPRQWFDTMLLASACGLPLSLGDVGAALKLPADKAKMWEGKTLISYFCKPCKATRVNGGRTRNLPEHDADKWSVFIEYNKRDVEVERTIYDTLLRWKPDRTEHKLFVIDQEINDKGMGVDLQLARNAVRIGDDYKAELMARATEISGLVNPNSNDQVKAWLLETEGKTVDSLNKKVIAGVKESLTTDEAKEFMALRDEFSKSSTKKYEKILSCATADEHIHGCFLMNGAGRTGRWAGRLVQLQNLPHDTFEDLDLARQLVRDGDEETFKLLYPDVQKTLSMLLRPTLIPEPGHKFLVADFSAIEARVVAWCAGEQWRMDAFAAGRDIYCESASKAFHIPVEKHGVNAAYRAVGKTLELACGYGGSVGAMLAFNADKLGMTEQEMKDAVVAWRTASPHIVDLWRSLERAAVRCVLKCVSTKESAEVVSTVGQQIKFKCEPGILWMVLPSGRRIAYWDPRVEDDNEGHKVLSYMGNDQKQNKKWTRIRTFGGKLTENLVQAASRDCLKETLIRLTDAGFDVRGHVHDEVIVTEPIGGRTAEDVCNIMRMPIDWAPGLVLNAAGFECSSYRKDD